MKTPQKSTLETNSITSSTNMLSTYINVELANIKSSSTPRKENQCRPKREASINASLKTSMILQDEVQEPKKLK